MTKVCEDILIGGARATPPMTNDDVRKCYEIAHDKGTFIGMNEVRHLRYRALFNLIFKFKEGWHASLRGSNNGFAFKHRNYSLVKNYSYKISPRIFGINPERRDHVVVVRHKSYGFTVAFIVVQWPNAAWNARRFRNPIEKHVRQRLWRKAKKRHLEEFANLKNMYDIVIPMGDFNRVDVNHPARTLNGSEAIVKIMFHSKKFGSPVLKEFAELRENIGERVVFDPLKDVESPNDHPFRRIRLWIPVGNA